MLHDKLKSMRLKSGLTQEQAAAQLPVVRQTLSKWEKGTSVPDAESLKKLADIYGTNITELLEIEMPQKESEEERIRQTLEKLSEALAIRNKRVQRLWNIVLIIGIGILVWGVYKLGFGICNYMLISKDTVLGNEAANMVMAGAMANVTGGAGRAVLGIVVIVFSIVLKKR